MSIVYVGLDLGSSCFHQVAISSDGSLMVNRSFSTSELNLRKAFSVQKISGHARRRPFTSELERLEFLFERYRRLVEPLNA
jgi:hypothetical protein